MIINEHMKIVGDVCGDEDLVVRGRIEGTVRISGVLTVEPGGMVAGEVSARAAAIYGTVLGNVSARDAIEVARSGHMIGDATAPRVAIIPGAAFRGRVEMLPAAAVEAEPAPLPTAVRPQLTAAVVLPEPTNTAIVAAPPTRRDAPPRRSAAPPPRPDRRAAPRGPQPAAAAPPPKPPTAREVPRLASLGRGPLRRRPER